MVKAPALERGLRVLQALGNGESISLEALAKQTDIPKASLLRICETLSDMGAVERCARTKLYRACMRLVPMGTEGLSFEACVHQSLNHLAQVTGQTAEWFVPREEGMVLLDRAEPVDSLVRVLARVGFVRAWEGELDCVAALGFAFGNIERPATVDNEFWEYHEDGKKATLDAPSARARIDEACRKKCMMDRPYNGNGVRRMAAALVHDDRFLGVLSLAQSYTPDGDTHLPARQLALLAEIETLRTNAFMEIGR